MISAREKVNCNIFMRPATLHPLEQSDLFNFFENHILAIFWQTMQFGMLKNHLRPIIGLGSGNPRFHKK